MARRLRAVATGARMYRRPPSPAAGSSCHSRDPGGGPSGGGQVPSRRSELTGIARSLGDDVHVGQAHGPRWVPTALDETDRRCREQADDQTGHRGGLRADWEPPGANARARRAGGEAPGPTRTRSRTRAVSPGRRGRRGDGSAPRSLRAARRRLDRPVHGSCLAAPEILGTKDHLARSRGIRRGPGFGVLTCAGARAHRDELLWRPDPVAREPHDVLGAIPASAIHGLPIIRSHGFAAPFRREVALLRPPGQVV